MAGRKQRVETRIGQFESRLLASPVILRLPDGSTRTIRGWRFFLLGLMNAASRGTTRTPTQAEQLELIRQAEFAEEPGGGHMIELIKVLLAAAEVDPSLNPELDAVG
jgi:hypothetical protein